MFHLCRKTECLVHAKQIQVCEMRCCPAWRGQRDRGFLLQQLAALVRQPPRANPGPERLQRTGEEIWCRSVSQKCPAFPRKRKFIEAASPRPERWGHCGYACPGGVANPGRLTQKRRHLGRRSCEIRLGGQGQNRTADTRIFSPRINKLCYFLVLRTVTIFLHFTSVPTCSPNLPPNQSGLFRWRRVE